MSQGSAGPVVHPMFAALRVVQAGVGEMVQAQCWSLSDGDVEEALAEVATVKAQLAAVELGLVAQADARGLGVAQATNTAGWLRSRLLVGPGEAKAAVKLAAALKGDCAATGAALARGACSAEQARVIVHTMGRLPVADPAVRARAEKFLIAQSAVLDPLLLRHAGEALIEALSSQPDRDGQILRDIARREFTAVPAYDGMVRLCGWMDREAWAEIAAVIDPLAAPAPADDGTPDPRSAARRRADALLGMARAAAAGPPAAGVVRPVLTVTIDFDSLSGQLAGMGRLNTGEQLSAAAARRIGCDAQIIPIVLGAASQPLDVGRSTRIVPAPLRRALVCRDQACAFPGCDRPAAWSQAHHIAHWSAGGATALNNLVLLCGQHHVAVHHNGWTVTLDQDGLPTFRPPPWIDPDQQPRRHHRPDTPTPLRHQRTRPTRLSGGGLSRV